MSNWIFQANPKHYDIAGALAGLDEILWRVPQYTGDIHVGDHVMLWESGKDAGVIAVGTICSEPALAPVPENEHRYVKSGDAEGAPATRVCLAVRPVDRVPKSVVASLPEMSDHGIITAPMGTVFPVDEAAWRALRTMVPDELPDVPTRSGATRSGIPEVFSWKDRRKDTYPLPGGYSGQMDTLAIITRHIVAQRPAFDEFADWLHTERNLSETNSRMLALFLRRSGMIREVSGRLEAGPAPLTLTDNGDTTLVIAQLHSRCRFIGELMEELRTPLTVDQVLQVANERYGMNWTTKAQIQRRRGWLQSAGMIEMDDSSCLKLTVAGSKLLAQLTLHEPATAETSLARVPAETDAATALVQPDETDTLGVAKTSGKGTVARAELEQLQRELRESSTRSKSPDDFEFAIRDAFNFLGFRAEKLGGSGKTDVVADADLGRDDAYRVIIDGKTTANGRVSDSQIDWDTIDDHRKLHHADYVVIAGPGFAGDRTRQRATNHNVVLMTADDLVELVAQHDVWPLSLDAYRRIFDGQSGEVDLEGVTEEAEASERLLVIASAVVAQIADHSSETGALSARELFLLLRNQPDLDATHTELAEAARALASPLVGVLVESDGGYRMSSSLDTAMRRSMLLARRLVDF